MKTMKYYYGLIIKYGVLLLVDVFEKLRINGLGPSRCLSAASSSQDAILNMTKIKLQYISDLDIYIFLGNSMRGGVSYISNKCSKANNKSQDSKQESKHITYLDSNNLYSHVMP